MDHTTVVLQTLLLLLVSAARPFAFPVLSTVLSAVENAAASSSETNALTLAGAQLAINLLLPTTDPPRPEQGGQRITKAWLRAQTDRNCIWAFRMTAGELIRLCKAMDITASILIS
ncbi:hypothetical protein C8R47DRAFT_1225274 [Mycena vitilis]|nr:hypothetical protein C8R47DRAFT_1225274 [Mycena vitilis]